MAVQTAMLQIRLYALYERSNKILAFMAVFFLAEVSSQLYAYITLDSTVQGWPRTFLRGKCLITFDSYEPTITRGIFLCFISLRVAFLWHVSDSCLRVDGILFEHLGWLSAFKSENFQATALEPGTHNRYHCSRKRLVLPWVSHASLSFGYTDEVARFTLLFVFAMVTFFIYGVRVKQMKVLNGLR